MIKKKDFIKMLEGIDDEDYVDLWLDNELNEEFPSIIQTSSKERDASVVYKHIIEAIADGYRQDWVSICYAVFEDNLDYVGFLGMVHVKPVIINGKVWYRIDEKDLKEGYYDGSFEPQEGYWLYQRCHYEDSYSGQMLIPLGGSWMLVDFRC